MLVTHLAGLITRRKFPRSAGTLRNGFIYDGGSMKTRNALATLAITTAAFSTARGDVVFGNFESGTAPGFGALSSGSGVQPWTSPVAGTVITAASGGLAGSKVLELTGTESFNMGYS